MCLTHQLITTHNTFTGMKYMAGTSASIESGNPQKSYRNMWGTNNQFGVVWLQTLVNTAGL